MLTMPCLLKWNNGARECFCYMFLNFQVNNCKALGKIIELSSFTVNWSPLNSTWDGWRDREIPFVFFLLISRLEWRKNGSQLKLWGSTGYDWNEISFTYHPWPLHEGKNLRSFHRSSEKGWLLKILLVLNTLHSQICWNTQMKARNSTFWILIASKMCWMREEAFRSDVDDEKILDWIKC